MAFPTDNFYPRSMPIEFLVRFSSAKQINFFVYMEFLGTLLLIRFLVASHKENEEVIVFAIRTRRIMEL